MKGNDNMLEKNNLIFIYGKAGNYKSSIGVSLLNSTDKKACYINLDNNHLKTNDNKPSSVLNNHLSTLTRPLSRSIPI